MASSYPYLNVARAHGVPYRDVLNLADRLEAHYDGGHYLSLRYVDWMVDTYGAFLAERARRQENF